MIEFHVTYENEDDAVRAANNAVAAGLAACANIVPKVHSIYRWQGGMVDEHEALTIFKTSDERADELGAYLLTGHPHDTPAILRHDNVTANPDYEDWIREETKSK